MGCGGSRIGIDEEALRACLDPRTNILPLLLRLSGSIPPEELIQSFDDAKLLPPSTVDLCNTFLIPTMRSHHRADVLVRCVNQLSALRKEMVPLRKEEGEGFRRPEYVVTDRRG